MKKISMVLASAVLILSACSKPSFEKDFANLFEDATKELNSAASDLKGAKDGASVAAALNKVYGTIVMMKTKGGELEKKHNMRAKGDMPAELKEKNIAFQEAVKNVFSQEAQMVMQKYATQPEVLEVLTKLKGLKGP